MTTERKSKISEKQLIETGALLSEIDEHVRFDDLQRRVDDLLRNIDKFNDRLEHIDEKFDNKSSGFLEKIDDKLTKTNERLHELEREHAKLEERVTSLKAEHGKSWLKGAEEIFENKNVRVSLLLFVGWLMSKAGPGAWEMLIKILGG